MENAIEHRTPAMRPPRPAPHLAWCAAALLLAGCASTTSYVPGSDVNLVAPNVITQSEMKAMAFTAVGHLLDDPTFVRVYGKKKAALERKASEGGAEAELPVLAMEPIKNLMHDGVSDSAATAQFAEDFMTILRRTDRFDVVDRFVELDMLDALAAGVDNGGDSSDVLENYGSYHAPDLWLSGNLRKAQEGPIFIYTLNLKLMDTATKRVFWSDTVELRKTKK